MRADDVEHFKPRTAWARRRRPDAPGGEPRRDGLGWLGARHRPSSTPLPPRAGQTGKGLVDLVRPRRDATLHVLGGGKAAALSMASDSADRTPVLQ